MTTAMLAPAKGDTINLLDGDGQVTENVAIVSEVIGNLDYFEVEDAGGERFFVVRYPEMDTDWSKGWVEIFLEDEAL